MVHTRAASRGQSGTDPAGKTAVAPTIDVAGSSAPKGALPLISVAFTAALLFGPLVIAAGLLTEHPSPSDRHPGIATDKPVNFAESGLSDLRGDID